MAPQTFRNHRHLLVLTTVAAAFWLAAVIAAIGTDAFGWHAERIAVAGTMLSVFVLIAMSRAYITRLQDRIILLEMKVRCAELLTAGEDAKLAQLAVPQIVALRFASDAELGGLLDRAVRERLSPNEIKATIVNWKADDLRT